MWNVKKAVNARETGRHRGEPKSRHGPMIVIGTVVAVLWMGILAFFLFRGPAPVIAPSEYHPSSAPSLPRPVIFPPQPTAAPRIYTAASGDSLWSMARKECGDGNDWKKLANANKIWWPWLVKQGRVITVEC